MNILERKSTVYSQNGEDGILSFIFSILNINKGTFIDVGAWDGIHLSNTFPLFRKGWEGIYIEADRDRFQKLNNNFKRFYPKIKCLNQVVGFSENNHLDLILDNNDYKNCSFDFMSIDVDGLEFNILKKVEKYLPKVICINVNPGHSPLFNRELPPEVAQNNIGQSINIIFKEMQKKGYFPLCYSGNLILIKNLYQHFFTPYLKSLKEMYNDYLEFLPTHELKYLYYYFIINRDFSDKGIVDDGAIFSNPELWHFCGDLAVKNRTEKNDIKDTKNNSNINSKVYSPIYSFDESKHNLSDSYYEPEIKVKSRVRPPPETQIPKMNPHSNIESKKNYGNVVKSKPTMPYLKGAQYQPKRHPSYKTPFPHVSTMFKNDLIENKKEKEYKFGVEDNNKNNFNQNNRGVSFYEEEMNDYKERRIKDLEDQLLNLYQEIRTLSE